MEGGSAEKSLPEGQLALWKRNPRLILWKSEASRPALARRNPTHQQVPVPSRKMP